MSSLTALRTHRHLRTLSIPGPTCVQLSFGNRWQGSDNCCWEEGWLWCASSEPWNFYLMHQLNRTYVDTLGGRRFGVPYIFVDGKHLSGNLDFPSASLSKCRSLTTIDIPNNAFTGRLPTNFNCKPISFGELCMMIYLICPEIYSMDEYQVHSTIYLILRSWIYPPMHFSLPSQNP